MPTRLTFTGAFMRSVAPALARLVTCLSLAGCALALAGQNADYNPAKPHMAYPEDRYKMMLAVPDEALAAMSEHSEPPVPA